MAYNPDKTRTWDQTTPNDGDLFDAEFNRIYENFNEYFNVDGDVFTVDSIVANQITAASISGNLTGNVTGDLTGNVTGDVTGNVTGDLTGDVKAANGTVVLDSGTDGTDAVFTGNVNGKTDEADIIIETGSLVKIKMKIIEIGDWNMDLTTSIQVNHGLDISTIRSVQIIIRNDDCTSLYPIDTSFNTNTPEVESFFYVYPDFVIIYRKNDGHYVNDGRYDNVSYNRGWITIWYTDQ